MGGWGGGGGRGGHEEISRRPKPKVAIEGGGGKCVLMYSNKYSTNLKSLRLSVNVVFATVLGLIPASSDTVES